MTTNEPGEHPVLHEEVLRGGQMWSRVLQRGHVLRHTDLDGGASVAAMFYNAENPLERYNMPDTLKAQHIARLKRGYVLFSDMGRVLCSVIEDTCGWHDTITGHMTAEASKKKYGDGTYQTLRNDWYRNTRDNFLVELGKYGLGKRDLVPNVNFFVKVAADANGRLTWVPKHSKPGSTVAVRSEMTTLVVLSNTPHPLDPSPAYAPKPVAVSVYGGKPAGPEDECRKVRPENGRSFELTEDYFAGRSAP